MKKILFLGGYDKEYSRNQIIEKAFRMLGYEVCHLNFKGGLFFIRYLRLLTMWLMLPHKKFDVIFIPAFRHNDVVLGKIISFISKSKLLFDPLISRYDKAVYEKKKYKAGGFFSNYPLLKDKISMMLADKVLADTVEHKKFFNDVIGIPEEKLHIIPVGADEELFKPMDGLKHDESFNVLFYGSFIPLHGVEVILEAFESLREYEKIKLVMIGGGKLYEKYSNDNRNGNVKFLKWVDYSLLPQAINSSDVVLGIFGNTEKAGRVIPNKVYQALACQKPVVTMRSGAYGPEFKDCENIKFANNSSESLKEAVLELYRDEESRKKIARGGYELFKTNFRIEKTAERLARIGI